MPNRFLRSLTPKTTGMLMAAIAPLSLLSFWAAPLSVSAQTPAPTPAQTPAPTPATPPTPAAPPTTTTPAPTPAQTPTPTTVCSYNSNGGVPNPLGMRAYITVSEIAGNSVFVYEQFPSPVAAATATPAQPATIANRRTLTLMSTPIADARQRVVAQPAYYAELLGTSVESLQGDGFGKVNDTLLCRPGNSATPPTTGTPPASPPATPPTSVTPPTTGTPPTSPPATPPTSVTPAPTLASLPDGNYRMASAQYPVRVVTDAELLQNGGYLFVFRKVGNVITGHWGHIDHEEGACITGTVSGNTITGQAYTNDKPTTIDGKTYLDPMSVLQLGSPVSTVRYDGSVMNVASLSRINAGTQLPPETCSGQF
jgi:hypothetical protein